jgi:hypothetical protein
VTEVLASVDFAPHAGADVTYHAKSLDFFVSNLLLGESKPFPLPQGYLEKGRPGVFQHGISGTGYKEEPHPSKKPWWRFW